MSWASEILKEKNLLSNISVFSDNELQDEWVKECKSNPKSKIAECGSERCQLLLEMELHRRGFNRKTSWEKEG